MLDEAALSCGLSNPYVEGSNLYQKQFRANSRGKKVKEEKENFKLEFFQMCKIALHELHENFVQYNILK